MTALLTELKTRARLQLNAAGDAQPELRLRDCLQQAARDVGFAHWEQARRALGALAVPGDDMGTFWHAPRCDSLLTAWFADYGDARTALAAMQAAVLLPYRRQFMVVNPPFVHELGLDPADPAWAGAQRDLVRAYGTGSWLALGMQRLKAPRSSFSSSAR